MALKEIRNVIESRLKTFAASKTIPVVYENVGSEVASSHFRIFIYPSPTQDPSIGAKHRRYRGIVRIQYYSTDLGKGVATIEAMGEELVALFPRALQLTKNSVTTMIENTPSQSSIGYESNYCWVTVEFNYRTEIITN